MNDTRNLLVEVRTLNISKDLIMESIKKYNGELIVQGIITQRNEHKNQNGRIYPREILEREVEKYNTNFVKQNRALGELDHPECVCPSASILYKDGWKSIKDVSVGDLIATLNTTTNTLEYNSVERVINQPYKGKMISIVGKNIDILVTPNHRFILQNRKGEFIEKTAQEILDISKVTAFPHLEIPITCENWNGVDYETFVVSGVNVSDRCEKSYIEKQKNDLVMNAKDWFSFLGFYLAEGHCSSENNGVFITQNKGEIADKFREILKNLNSELVWKERDKRENCITFSVYDARLWTYLNKLGNKYSKYVPQDIKDASVPLLQNLYDWFLNGDGTCVGEYERSSIFSVSKKLMEDFNEIFLKLGFAGVIREQITEKDYMFAGHLIEAKNKSTLYRLWAKESKSVHLDFRFIKIKEVDYDDTVHCVTVKNGSFYCKNNNKPFWSGNSSTVNLKNVSHSIMELLWEGDNLVGKIKILTTPSGNIAKELFKCGVQVGISSRALGSVKKIDENTVEVQDDLEIVAWDLVSNPSVAVANLSPMSSITEGVNNNKPVTIASKYKNVEKIIRDILMEIK